MSTKPLAILTAGLIFIITSCAQQQQPQLTDSSKKYKGIEFEIRRVQEPEIPNYMVKIPDFGALSGVQVLNSKAFADAINVVSEKGGGKVIIPAGIRLNGPIVLKSNLELYTEAGALIVFSSNKDLYPVIKSSFEGVDT